MLDAVMSRANRWALDWLGPRWVDYLASNTMTEFNRWVNDFIWTYEFKAQVLQVIDEAPGVKTFVLRPNQHWRGFKPGQHIELQLQIDGRSVRRHYSISAARSGTVSITVKRVAHGQVSGWLHDHLRAGMQLHISPAQGRFCHEGQAKVLYLCAGSGITPCHAMVNALLQEPLAQRADLQVIAQFRQAADVIFKPSLQHWAREGVRVTTALSSLAQAEPGPYGAVPRVDALSLLRLCPDLKDRDIYLCGPTGFMAQMLDTLSGHGVDMARVHTERFVAADAAAPEGGDFDIDGAEVYFQHLDQRVTLTGKDQGKTLLQLALDHGVPLESGCCQGMCGTCRLNLQDGRVSGNVLGQVVYLCTAYPASREMVLNA
jgi:ferredoxin-NADP reductase